MRKLFVSFTVLIGLLLVNTAHADTFSFSCKTSPSFLSSVRKALADKVQAEIDTSLFSEGRTSVGFKLISVQSDADSLTTDELLSGITVHDSGDPVGLAFGVDGDVNFNSTGTCTYTYRVIIATRGRDNSNNQRIITRTSSEITVTTPAYGGLRRGN